MEVVETFYTKENYETDIWMGNEHFWVDQSKGHHYQVLYFHIDDAELLIERLKTALENVAK